jgi:hypothetical protein
LELMSDILHRYLQEITRLSHHYAELCKIFTFPEASD